MRVFCKRLPASNTFKDLRTEGWVVTRAKTDIRAGEELTFLYAAKMEGRWNINLKMYEV